MTTPSHPERPEQQFPQTDPEMQAQPHPDYHEPAHAQEEPKSRTGAFFGGILAAIVIVAVAALAFAWGRGWFGGGESESASSSEVVVTEVEQATATEEPAQEQEPETVVETVVEEAPEEQPTQPDGQEQDGEEGQQPAPTGTPIASTSCGDRNFDLVVPENSQISEEFARAMMDGYSDWCNGGSEDAGFNVTNPDTGNELPVTCMDAPGGVSCAAGPGNEIQLVNA